MLKGIERIAKAVGVTLGPKGRNVVIRQPNGQPKITKDGVTVARAIEFTDQYEDVGAKLIREVASNTNNVAGDGTTTATVLAWSIFAEGYKSVATGANPMDLKRGIDFAVDDMVASLERQKRPVESIEMLENVATISANGERPLGKMIAAAVTAVGPSGFIAVAEGRTHQTEWEQHAGWSVERGFVDVRLVDGGAMHVAHKDSLVFVHERSLDNIELLVKLLETAKAQGKPLTLISPDISQDAMDLITANHQAVVVKVGLVLTPFTSTANASDLAASCGTRVYVEREYGSLSNLQQYIGTAKEITQTMDCSVIVGDADVTSRVAYLSELMDRTLSDEEREDFRARIAKLNKKFAVIRVGGRSVVTISESKDRVIDALNAARAALQEGIVAGGGAALLHATKNLDELLLKDEEMEQDRRTGIMIVRNAARLPLRMIADNAGEEGPVVVEMLSESGIEMGYDAQNDEYRNMFEAGIVDPVRVVRSCIRDAAAIASLMITTEASICDDQPVVTLDVKNPYS